MRAGNEREQEMKLTPQRQPLFPKAPELRDRCGCNPCRKPRMAATDSWPASLDEVLFTICCSCPLQACLCLLKESACVRAWMSCWQRRTMLSHLPTSHRYKEVCSCVSSEHTGGLSTQVQRGALECVWVSKVAESGMLHSHVFHFPQV